MLTLGKIQELSVLQAARFGYTLGEEPVGENTVTRLPEGRMVSDWRHGS